MLSIIRTTTKLMIVAAVLLCSQHSKVQAQNKGLESQRLALTHVGQALSRVVVKAKKANEQLGYGFYEGGCLFGVRMAPRSSTTETLSLKAGQLYVFIGGGDKTARNVDIVLRDSKGRIVSQDTESDAAPFVLFQPKSSGRYTMSLGLKSGWRGSAFCAVTILRKGGYKLPLERIVQAAIKMDYAAFATFRDLKGGRLNEMPNTWGLYGAVIQSGRAISSVPRRYNATNRGIVAVGDSSIRDLNLSLVDGKGSVIVTDTKNGASPKIVRQMAGGTYSLGLSNNNSSGPALTMAILLDLPSRPSTKTQAVTSTPISSTSIVPSKIPSSPFAGDWKGDWADEKKGRVGTFKLFVQPNGTVTGRLYQPALDISSKFVGFVAENGALILNFSKSGREILVETNLMFSTDERKDLEGLATFSSEGLVLGGSEFSLKKDD